MAKNDKKATISATPLYGAEFNAGTMGDDDPELTERITKRLEALRRRGKESNWTEERDVEAAYKLLAGDVVKDKKGLPTKRYLSGDLEIEARRALARLLRDRKPLDSLLRLMLAASFDPSPTGDVTVDEILDINPIERQLIFAKGRGSRSRGQAMRHRFIADKVFAERYNSPHKRVTDIEGDEASDLEVSVDTVKVATHRFRNRFQKKILERAKREKSLRGHKRVGK